MARIRTIKPEFWADEKLSPQPPLVRLVFVGLISQADDAGRLIDSVKLLDGLLFPYTDETCEEALVTLEGLGVIQRGVTEGGQRVIQLVSWKNHQRIDRPNLSGALPPIHLAALGEDSPNDRRSFDEPSRLDRDQEGEEDQEREYDRDQEGERVARTREGASHGQETDLLATWLGEHAHVLDACPFTADPLTRLALHGHYAAGMRANAWKRDDGTSVDEADRPRLLALALTGYAAEGKRVLVTNEFAGMLKATVRAEYATHSDSPSPRDEAAEHQRRKEAARSREANVNAELERKNAEGAAILDGAAEAKAWLQEQPDDVQTQVAALMTPGLRKLGVRDPARAPWVLVAPVMLGAVKAYREKQAQEASA